MNGMLDLYKTNYKLKPANFQELIDNYFGDGLSKHFMTPYNFKVKYLSISKQKRISDRIKSNLIELIRLFLCFFCLMKDVRFGSTLFIILITWMHHIHFSLKLIRSNRTELFTKKKQKNKKSNSFLIRFGKRLALDSFTVNWLI
jgi:hypothetical protein